MLELETQYFVALNAITFQRRATNRCKPLGEELLGSGCSHGLKVPPLDYLLIANEGFSLHQERSSCHFLSQAVKSNVSNSERAWSHVTPEQHTEGYVPNVTAAVIMTKFSI